MIKSHWICPIQMVHLQNYKLIWVIRQTFYCRQVQYFCFCDSWCTWYRKSGHTWFGSSWLIIAGEEYAVHGRVGRESWTEGQSEGRTPVAEISFISKGKLNVSFNKRKRSKYHYLKTKWPFIYWLSLEFQPGNEKDRCIYLCLHLRLRDISVVRGIIVEYLFIYLF